MSTSSADGDLLEGYASDARRDGVGEIVTDAYRQVAPTFLVARLHVASGADEGPAVIARPRRRRILTSGHVLPSSFREYPKRAVEGFRHGSRVSCGSLVTAAGPWLPCSLPPTWPAPGERAAPPSPAGAPVGLVARMP